MAVVEKEIRCLPTRRDVGVVTALRVNTLDFGASAVDDPVAAQLSPATKPDLVPSGEAQDVGIARRGRCRDRYVLSLDLARAA